MTSSPIGGADIQVLTHHRGKKIEARGIAGVSNSRGSFQVTGLTGDGNPIDVSASGYSTRIAFGTNGGSEGVDFGTIPLFRKQSVELRLIIAGNADASGYISELNGTQFIPDRHFSQDGVLRY
jgi:hypothetical protein